MAGERKGMRSNMMEGGREGLGCILGGVLEQEEYFCPRSSSPSSPISELSVYKLLLRLFPGHWLWSFLSFPLSLALDKSTDLRIKERKSETVCTPLNDGQGNYDWIPCFKWTVPWVAHYVEGRESIDLSSASSSSPRCGRDMHAGWDQQGLGDEI